MIAYCSTALLRRRTETPGEIVTDQPPADAEEAAADAAEEIVEEAEEAASNAKDLWNYHWAGVVMVNPDGSFMTLENLSVEDAAAVNEDWYFALYQADGEGSFHAVNCLDDHVVDGATTIVMKNTESLR